MAYVPIPKNLKNIKTKIMFGLTGRQLGLFSIALIFAIPTYLITYSLFKSSTLSLILLIIIVAPFLFFALFEKDGLTGEKWIKQMIKVKYRRSSKRIYRNDNRYRFINEVIKKEKTMNRSE